MWKSEGTGICNKADILTKKSEFEIRPDYRYYFSL